MTTVKEECKKKQMDSFEKKKPLFWLSYWFSEVPQFLSFLQHMNQAANKQLWSVIYVTDLFSPQNTDKQDRKDVN